MKTTKEHIKVFETLILAASDTREDTLVSIIINTLFQVDKIEKESISKVIEDYYGFEPYKDELFQIINKLVSEGKIDLKNDIYSLSDEEKDRLQKLDREIRDKDEQRFQNFKNFIKDNINASIETSTIKLIWGTFVEYLYNNFYEYGEDALKRLHPYIDYSESPTEGKECIQLAYDRLKDEELCNILRIAIERFPDYASSEDINFLNDLAQKTLSFASLGINPKSVDGELDFKILDWVLYLDTNVLYSLLDLHSHPENDACKALIMLIRENKDYLKVVLRYSELTKKELNAKREDFKLLDEKLTDSTIRALLRSEKLDDFSKQFYENLLTNRDSTLHPSKVIDLAPNTLIKREIDIARNQKRVEKLGEEYLDSRIQDYRRYIDEINKIKQEHCALNKIPFYEIFRSDKQITHDITLREIILDQRSSVLKQGEVVTMNSAKYFGVTLDELLLKYDKRQVKDFNDGRSFPVFFKPSFLLNKLIKVLPIKTNDYKKAFIKAIASRGFNKDVQKSHDILKIVNYLKAQGIDDEQIVFSLITEDLFLEKYKNSKNKQDFNQGEFIESELNRKFKQREEELTKTKKALQSKEDEVKLTSIQSKELSERKNSLEIELDLYKKALTKVQSDVEKLKNQNQYKSSQQQINFDAAQSKQDADLYRTDFEDFINEEINKYKSLKLKAWQNKIWWNLFWVIPFSFFIIYFILFPPTLKENAQMDIITVRVVLGVFLLLFDGIFVWLIRSRYWDEGNKQKKRENIEPPLELTNKLKELKKVK